MKIIKLTKKQLKEAEGNEFKYLGDSDVPSHNGQSEISANGKISDDEYGEPVTTDDVSSKITPNSYNRYSSYAYSNIKKVRESFEDKDNDGIDDFYDNEDMEVLTDNDMNDNLTRIPKGVENKINILLSQINSNSLSAKQQAIVLYKILDNLDTKSLPISWKKKLILKINSNKNDTSNK